MQAIFNDTTYALTGEHYQGNDRKAIYLNNGPDDFIVATINIPEEPLDDDEVIIKDYSENEGMLATLIQAGILDRFARFVKTGHVVCPVYNLTAKALKLW